MNGNSPTEEEEQLFREQQELLDWKLKALMDQIEADHFVKLKTAEDIVKDAKATAEDGLYYVIWDYNKYPLQHEWIAETGTDKNGVQYFKFNHDFFVYDSTGKQYMKDRKTGEYSYRLYTMQPDGSGEWTIEPAPEISWKKNKQADLGDIDTVFMIYISNIEKNEEEINRLKHKKKVIDDPIKFTRAGTVKYLKELVLQHHYSALTEYPEKQQELDAFVADLINSNPYILPDKTKYRTRAEASTKFPLAEVPPALAVITQRRFANSFNFNDGPDNTAYLQMYQTLDGMKFDNGKLYFDSMLEHTAELRDLRTKEGITEIDLLSLRMFYSIYLQNVSEQLKRGEEPSDSISIYIPDLLKKTGRGHHKEHIDQLVNTAKSYQNMTGVVRVQKNGRQIPYEDEYQVLVFESYEESTNTLTVSVPYMNHLVQEIFELSKKKDKKGHYITKTNGEFLTNATHSYLIHADIAQEKNKAAAENVIILTTLIEQAGNNEPHISAEKLIERNVILKQRLERNSNPNQLLQRVFKKTWSLLREKTDLQKVYKNIMLPSPSDPAAIPTSATLKTMVFRFPHEGKIKEK